MTLWDWTHGLQERQFFQHSLPKLLLILCFLHISSVNMEKATNIIVDYSDKDKFKFSFNLTKSSSSMLFNNNQEIQCPSIVDSSACPCYKFEDGLFLECPGITAVSLKMTLQMITSPIQSLSIYDFDRSVSSLSQDLFQPGVNVKHLQFSHSHLEIIKENSFKNIKNTLESLSVINGQLTQVPRKALSGMQKLMILDLDSNQIDKIEDYSFYGLRLVKLNMKGNRLEVIPEYAFAGLEESITEIDLSENKLEIFPISALKRLDNLRSLRLSLNKISTIYSVEQNNNGNMSIADDKIRSLIFLDLSSNNFESINNNSFSPFPHLKTLSLYSNRIKTVHRNSFQALGDLMFLDMSYNHIIYLDEFIFEKNKLLQTIDMSHNHIHSINGVFTNLPQLREVFLSENNILELGRDVFTNSTNIDVIYLESNAIRHIDPNVFVTIVNLEQLYLRSNFIPQIPVTLLDKTLRLTSISLDDNEIKNLEVGMFRKLDRLREIRLHNNQIRIVTKGIFHPLPNLLDLHLQKNSIEDIETSAFSNLINLQNINLQENKLTSIENIFLNENESNLSALLSVQLHGNNIAKIHPKTFRRQERIQVIWLTRNCLTKIEKHIFKDLKHLEKAHLSENLISEIDTNAFSFVQELKFLDLSYNFIKIIHHDIFSSLKKLEELNLSNNHIRTISEFSFQNLKQLKILDLSSNPLVQIDKDLFQNDLQIIHLNIRNCSLQKIETGSLYGLTNLNELNVEDNFLNLTDVENLDIQSLRNLKLSNNNFSLINSSGVIQKIFNKLRSLQYLTLVKCVINSIPERIFLKNTNLVMVDLSNNYIRSINRNIFNGLNVFKELRLCYNRLIDFPHIALYNISTLEILTISNNYLSNIDFFKLSGIPNIRYLDFKNNMISTLSGFSAVNLTQLDYIDLSGNKILTLPVNFLHRSINLQRVELSNNRLLQIPSSTLLDLSLARFFWLNLTGNPINKIYTVKGEYYSYLKELYMCQTNLTILTSKDFEGFKALQHLHLTHNRIMRISPGAFYSLTNLITLDMSVNELELIPRERLQGLKLLKILNISHNSLKDLEEFSSDLTRLKVLDLSFNQLDRISKHTFKHLKQLTELYLMGNRMVMVSTDAFKYLQCLETLDIRKNYFENIPLEALKSLETSLKLLRVEENPLHCNCDSQELWEWLRDHKKWMNRKDNVDLRCEQPNELRGKTFSVLEPKQFCDAPLILKLAIQDIQPYSVVVSWQSRDHPGLYGYEIVYHALDGINEIRGTKLNGSANSVKLAKLSSSTRYLICVLGTGNFLTFNELSVLNRLYANDSTILTENNNSNNNNAKIEAMTTDLRGIFINSPFSRCTEVRTLEATPSLITDESSLSRNGIIHSILTRRLGLIVGCCLGIIVFIVLISVLGYLKLKKQRIENLKRQHQMPPEYISYRHFSLQNDESNRANNILNNSLNITTVSGMIVTDENQSNSNYVTGVTLGTTNLTSC